MSKFVTRLTRFLKDESAATAIEYSLIAVLIGVVLIAAYNAVGTNLSTSFQSVASSVK